MNSVIHHPTERSYGKANVRVYEDREKMGLTAAADAANLIREAVAERGYARIYGGDWQTPQLDVVDALVKETAVPWKVTEIFHMDEYLGIAADHPASFRRWIREHVEEPLHPVRVNYIEGDAADPDLEIERYTKLLQSGPIDVAFVGFGENGHIAFNDPPVANFQDPFVMRRVTLDAACLRQQVGEGPLQYDHRRCPDRSSDRFLQWPLAGPRLDLLRSGAAEGERGAEGAFGQDQH